MKRLKEAARSSLLNRAILPKDERESRWRPTNKRQYSDVLKTLIYTIKII